jgi:hypothetical protein
MTALLYACKGGHLPAASIIVDYNADVDATDNVKKAS